MSLLYNCSLLLLLLAQAPAQQMPPQSQPVEAEVRENILNQQIGPATVRDLDLPEPFLQRAADRVIRESYQDRFRRVVVPGNDPNESRTDDKNASPNVVVKYGEIKVGNTTLLYLGLGAGLFGVSAVLLLLACNRGETS